MSEKELVMKFYDNKKAISNINAQLNSLAEPINKYYKKRLQAEHFSDGLMPNSIKVGITSFLLILTPWLLTKIIGFILLTGVIGVNTVFASMLLRNKVLHKSCSQNIAEYNKLVYQQWHLLKSQEIIKSKIEHIKKESQKSELSKNLLLELSLSETSEADYIKELNSTINLDSSITDDDIYNLNINNLK